MKIRVVIMLLLVFIMFGGCQKGEDLEVIADDWKETLVQEPAHVQFNVPDDVSLEVMSGNDWKVYQGDYYQILVQHYPSGDLDRTLKDICGYTKEDLTVIEITGEDIDKYLFGWSAVSEEGELVGRCAVLDDGRFHYCLSVLVNAEKSGELRGIIDSVFASYSIDGY